MIATHYFHAGPDMIANATTPNVIHMPVAKNSAPADYIPVIHTISLEVDQITDTGPVGFQVYADIDHLTSYLAYPLFGASKTISAGESDTLFVSFPNGLVLHKHTYTTDPAGVTVATNLIYSTEGTPRNKTNAPIIRLKYGGIVASDVNLYVTYSYLSMADSVSCC